MKCEIVWLLFISLSIGCWGKSPENHSSRVKKVTSEAPSSSRISHFPTNLISKLHGKAERESWEVRKLALLPALEAHSVPSPQALAPDSTPTALWQVPLLSGLWLKVLQHRLCPCFNTDFYSPLEKSKMCFVTVYGDILWIKFAFVQLHGYLTAMRNTLMCCKHETNDCFQGKV